jgi:large subunit ribosomal protein L2
MALIKMKPTSPGTRQVVKVDRSHLHKGEPHAPLTTSQSKTGARNHSGRITTRHKGGGSRQKYRIIDFKRDKDGIAGVVETVEYDPNRTAHIALLCYVDGERRYIIAPKGLKAGDQVIAGSDAPIRAGNTLPLRNIPVGTTIHAIELRPGGGAKMGRSAGAKVQLVGKEGTRALLRLPSGEMRYVDVRCRATVGEVGNAEQSNINWGKAGRNRWKGKRPTVRGVAMNPVAHPHGGGEGKTSGGRHPVNPAGKPEGRTRRKGQESDKLIVRRRYATRKRG